MAATIVITKEAVMKNRSETPITARLVHQRSFEGVGDSSELKESGVKESVTTSVWLTNLASNGTDSVDEPFSDLTESPSCGLLR